jgi:hypothetical protein
MKHIEPPIKWIGSKRYQLQTIVPKLLDSKNDTYIEPFLGSGAVVIELLKHKRDMKYRCNDINTAFPYPIRRTSTGNINSECLSSEYMEVKLNLVPRLKHRVIALQWIANDDPDVKTQVDHIDRNKLNNHITNLRWVTPSENSKNRTFKGRRKFEYIYELPDEAIQITEFDGIYLDRYYFDPENEQILLRTKTKQVKYQIVHPTLNKNCLRIRLNDVDGKKLERSYTTMMRELIDYT